MNHTGGYFKNQTTTGLEDLLMSGSTHGSLRALKKWRLMDKPLIKLAALSGVLQGSVFSHFYQ